MTDQLHPASRSQLVLKANNLPKTSGCYLMLNEFAEVIYVGKAKNLKNRVISYFNQSSKTNKTYALLEQIADFQFILTSNEVESFVLENNLIKKHAPKYNIRLRDDKTYPYLQYNKKETYPRLEFTRRPKKNRLYKVLGPYPDGFAFSKTLQAITKLFSLRDCTTREFLKRQVPCLLYQMEQCSAPCVGHISIEDYAGSFKEIVHFFSDPAHSQNFFKLIEEKMKNEAVLENFEKALAYRELLFLCEQFQDHYQKQQVEDLASSENCDLLGLSEIETEIDLSLYTIRKGVLIGVEHFFWKRDVEEDSFQSILSQLSLYYEKAIHPPETIYCSFTEEQIHLGTEVLNRLMGSNKIVFAKSSRKFSKLLEETKSHALEESKLRKEVRKEIDVGLVELKELLGMDYIPQVIEGYDIAIWQGKSPTAAQIVFVEGRPAKNQYRYYHLNERWEGNNDFAMIEETIERRLKSGRLPDLWVIDGGKGQLSSAQKILRQHNISNCFVIALAKEKSDRGVKDRIFISEHKDSISLEQHLFAKRILVHLRDEAHRFCRKLHHHAEKKRMINE